MEQIPDGITLASIPWAEPPKTGRPGVIDPATLHDLEILSSATVGGATLLTLVDRTRTRAGSDQLRRRLAAPERSADRIMALQAAHRHLATRAREYQAHLTQ